MRMKRFFTVLFACALFSEAALAQEQPQASDRDAGVVAQPVEQSPATAPAAAPEEAKPETKEEPKWYDSLKLNGDFRYRHEMLKEEDEDARNRQRIRARFGVTAALFEDLEVGIRIATGVGGDPVSTNQTLTEAFSTKPIWLDVAYFDYHPSWAEGLHATAGKIKNPFYAPGKAELIWDHDLNPEGMALSYDHAFGIVEPFIAGGGFWVEERKEDKDSWLAGVQGGLKLEFVKDYFSLRVGGGYFDYTATEGNATFYDPTDSFGNAAEEVTDDEGVVSIVYANDYNLVEGFAEVGGKIVKLPWAVFFDFVRNVDLDDDNNGWLVGLTLGKCKEAYDFQLRYNYRQLEADAVMAAFTDSDFAGGGTDGKGHEAGFDFQLHKYVVAGVTYFYADKPIEDSPPEIESIALHRLQIDLNFKF